MYYNWIMPGIESKQPGDAYRPAIGDERLVIRSGSYTLASEKHPERNEDALYTNDSAGVYAVFDGVGGSASGAQASAWAVEKLDNAVRGGYLDVTDPTILTDRLEFLMRDLHTYVKQHADRSPNTEGSCTTAVLIKVIKGDRPELFIANVGDSRASVLRHGRLLPLTLDDGSIRGIFDDEADMWEAQEALDRVDTMTLSSLSPDLQNAFRKRNVINSALGSGLDRPAIYREDLLPGDRILLSSDGVGDNLTSQEITEILAQDLDVGALARGLCGASVRKSRTQSIRAKKDDMTAVVLDVRSAPSPQAGNKSGRKEDSRFLEQRRPEAREAKRMEDVKTVDGLWDAIGARSGIQGSSAYHPREYLYEVAADIFDGRRGLSAATSGEGFRRAVGRVGCRQYAKNMVTGGHEQVFLGAELRWGEEQVLYQILEQLGTLEGSREVFDKEQLKDLAFKVLNGQALVARATRTQGFRQALANMLEDRRNIRR